jgi:hypothetical protein
LTWKKKKTERKKERKKKGQPTTVCLLLNSFKNENLLFVKNVLRAPNQSAFYEAHYLKEQKVKEWQRGRDQAQMSQLLCAVAEPQDGWKVASLQSR